MTEASIHQFKAALATYRGSYIAVLLMAFAPLFSEPLMGFLKTSPVNGIVWSGLVAMIALMGVYYFFRLKKLTGAWYWW